MSGKRPTLNITRRLDGGGIRLVVTYERRRQRYGLGQECTAEEWNEAAGRYRRSMPGYRMKNEVLTAVLKTAGDVVDDILRTGDPFTFHAFEEGFRPKESGKAQTVVDLIEVIADEMRAAGRVGNGTVYYGLGLRVAEHDKRVRLNQVTLQWLNRFEAYLQQTCTAGGIRQYMSTLRAVMNRAIADGTIPLDAYPFGKRGYEVGKHKSALRPRPLSDDWLAQVKSFPPTGDDGFDDQIRYFLLMYYARGMNFADIAHLKWSMIYEGRIHYTRRKTMRSGTGANFTVLITPEIAAILEHFPQGENEYVFRILDHRIHSTPQQRHYRMNKCRAKLNDTMREVAARCGITMNVTSYVARHTFGAVLLRKGVSKRELGDAYGHKDSATTEHYAEQLIGSELDHLQDLL